MEIGETSNHSTTQQRIRRHDEYPQESYPFLIGLKSRINPFVKRFTTIFPTWSTPLAWRMENINASFTPPQQQEQHHVCLNRLSRHRGHCRNHWHPTLFNRLWPVMHSSSSNNHNNRNPWCSGCTPPRHRRRLGHQRQPPDETRSSQPHSPCCKDAAFRERPWQVHRLYPCSTAQGRVPWQHRNNNNNNSSGNWYTNHNHRRTAQVLQGYHLEASHQDIRRKCQVRNEKQSNARSGS